MVDIDVKKVFLQQGSDLYGDIIALTASDTIKRYLAFRVIVNAMSFEDLVRDRRYPVMRKIRNTLLAHKQQPGFFDAFQAVDHITRSTISELLSFMAGFTHGTEPHFVTLEMHDSVVRKRFRYLVRTVLDQYANDELDGYRLTNNFLAYTGSHVHEVSGGDLAGVFYRYNSSKALFCLAQYIFNNTYQDTDFAASARHAKLDMILHAQNMADCVFRDTRNPHSIDGLLEVCIAENLGDTRALRVLKSDGSFQRNYRNVRNVRNRLIGHMDTRDSLAHLLALLDQLPICTIHGLVNSVDKTVYDATRPHPALRTRYHSISEPLNSASIIDIPGLKPKPYDD